MSGWAGERTGRWADGRVACRQRAGSVQAACRQRQAAAGSVQAAAEGLWSEAPATGGATDLLKREARGILEERHEVDGPLRDEGQELAVVLLKVPHVHLGRQRRWERGKGESVDEGGSQGTGELEEEKLPRNPSEEKRRARGEVPQR